MMMSETLISTTTVRTALNNVPPSLPTCRFGLLRDHACILRRWSCPKTCSLTSADMVWKYEVKTLR